MQAVYGGKDVFGFGKSVCYQALPFLFDHKLGLVSSSRRSCVIVISPLIALMVDQVRNLRQSDVHAVIISSSSRDRSSVPMEFVASDC